MKVRVPASTSNLGAGFDVLGIALDLWLTAEILTDEAKRDYVGTVASLAPGEDLVQRYLNGIDPNIRVYLESDIPIGKGLGSSGAATVAAVALGQLFKVGSVDRQAIVREAIKLEGHPDNVTPAVLGGAVLAIGNPTRVAVHPSIAIALAIPESSVSTQEARRRIPESQTTAIATEQAGRCAALVLGLERGDTELISFGFQDRIAVPARRTMIPGYDRAVEAAEAAGAAAATISGSGSAIVAVCRAGREDEVGEAMCGALAEVDNPAYKLTPSISPMGLEVLD